MTFWYNYRSVPFSGIIRDASSSSIWEQIQRPAGRYYEENERPLSNKEMSVWAQGSGKPSKKKEKEKERV